MVSYEVQERSPQQHFSTSDKIRNGIYCSFLEHPGLRCFRALSWVMVAVSIQFNLDII